MMANLQRLLMSLALLGAAAMVLLLSDLHSRKGARRPHADRMIPVALVKHASNSLLDEVEQGVIDALAERGYRDGAKISLERFSADGDVPTSTVIAKRVTDGSFRLVVSISTLSLQAVANANSAGRTPHVFGAVTDPSASGVGIRAMGTTNKPPWMAGIGTFQPVESIFRMARESWPGLKVVGVVWNPAERNSEMCVLKGRQVCAEFGIQLVEATVDQTKDVRDAAGALVARGAQAFWTGFDLTVYAAMSSLCEVAARADIPVFSNNTGHLKEGTLFELGANYGEVGRQIGNIAADVLGGADPAKMAVENFMPERVMLNRQVLGALRDPWKFTDEAVARAVMIIGADGSVEKDAQDARAGPASAAAPARDRPHKIAMAYFGPDEGTDSTIAGMMDGLRERGLEEGRDFSVVKYHANGEIGAIAPIMHAIDSGDADVVVTFSTPVLTAACSAVRRKPVVFTYCTDPVAADAGKTFEDHLPFVTGIGSFPPIEDAVKMITLTFPKARRIGTLYNTAEANSVREVGRLRDLCGSLGLELVEAAAGNTAEVVPAAQSLVARGVDVAFLPGDNTAYQAFEGIASTLAAARVPLVIDAPEFTDRGALAAVGVGYYNTGFATAEPLARVMAGESPAKIPFRNVAQKQVKLNLKVASRLGVRFPPEVMAMRTEGAKSAATGAKPVSRLWRIHQLYYLESPLVEDSTRGFREGLVAAGLREGADFTLKTLSAQGDMTALGSLFDSARIAGVDLFVVFSTPTLQTAVKKVRDVPVLFTVVADPFLAGAGRTNDDHLPNITGVCTQGPYAEMAELLVNHFPQIKRVGTLFCPSEANSVANRDLFVREAARRGIRVEAVAVNAAAELADAALALCGRGPDAVVQIIDNLTAAGFPAIARAARQARIPIFTFQDATIGQGASLVLSRDYRDAGVDTAAMAVRIMRGESPATIPFAPPRTVRLLIHTDNAAAVGLRIPGALLEKAQRVLPGPSKGS